MEIAGKKAIVVGGASGLGRASAELLAAAGATVAIMDLAKSAGAEIAAQLGGIFLACDIADHEATERAVDEAAARLGAIHIGVNVAGGGAGARRLLDADGPYPLEIFQRVVQLNLVASFNLSRLEAKHMARNGPDAEGERGVIINTSSMTAFGGPVGLVPYSTVKAGVAGLSLPMARDLAPYGIRVNAIAPTMFETGILTAMDPQQKAELLSEAVFPKRPGKPEEFAKLVRAIVENPMLNGGTIRLDAGTLRACRDTLGDRLAGEPG